MKWVGIFGGKKLSIYSNNRNNNFNLIRLIAALMVLVSHSFALTSGSGDAEPFVASLGMSLGTISVDVFFVISGFLITSSFFGKRNLAAFLWARILRIYPGAIVAVLFCVLILGPIFTSYGLPSYFSDARTLHFLSKNMFLFGIKYDLPGVFLHNHFAETVNGSLWTLPYELRMYIDVAVLGSLILFLDRKMNANLTGPAFGLIASFLLVGDIANHFMHIASGDSLKLAEMFFYGGFLYVYRHKITMSPIFSQ